MIQKNQLNPAAGCVDWHRHGKVSRGNQDVISIECCIAKGVFPKWKFCIIWRIKICIVTLVLREPKQLLKLTEMSL